MSDDQPDTVHPDRRRTSELYVLAHTSLAELMTTLSEADWSTPVPCLPGWDVRDVLSHVSGVPDDAIAGRMEGAPGEAWTASQVERNRQHSVDELLERWASQAAGFAEVLDAIGETRPPFDCHSHEHDIRHALGRPGGRDSVLVEVAGVGLAQGFEHAFPVAVELTDGRVLTSGAGNGAAVTLQGMSTFELFRSRLGRRSPEQVRAYDWSGSDDSIAEVIAGWFTFGPATTPIVE